MRFDESIAGVSSVVLFLLLSSSCMRENDSQSRMNNNFYQGKPKANVELFVAEVDNGGFNQYFSNFSGVDCFETLRSLKKSGKKQTAQLLQAAINLINPKDLPEYELIEKLRKREVSELEDEQVNRGLSKLDSLFYTEPDGPIIP